MKGFKFISILATAAFIMAACGNDEENVSTGSDAGNAPAEVRFSARTAEIQTRVANSTWAAGDPVGIYMIGADGGLEDENIREDANNRQYTASAAGTSAEFAPVGDDKIYYPMSGNVEFIAYHPYKATDITADFKLPVSVAVQTSQTAIDVLYAPKTTGSYSKSTKSTPVELQFTHKLVKLVFSISAGGGVTESLNDLTVKITSQQTAATLDLTDGTVTSSGNATDVTALAVTDGAAYEAIVLPNAAVTDMTFTFTTTGAGSGTYEVNVPVPAASKWESGKKYTYTVTLKRNDVKISGEVSDWNDGGGDAVTALPKLPQPPQIVYTNPGHTEYLYMLPYNLGVTEEGKFLTVEEQMEAAKNLTESNDIPSITGGLFQWGRADDGHELRSSGTYGGPVAVSSSDGQVEEGSNGYGLFITTGSTPFDWRGNTTDKWEGTSDPCSCVKDGGKAWRLPTSAEWQQITDYNSRETTAKGLRLKPDGNTVSVFLPAAGLRNRITGELVNMSLSGYYWSSTASGTSALFLYFNATTVSPTGSYSRSNGFSVRCVAE